MRTVSRTRRCIRPNARLNKKDILAWLQKRGNSKERIKPNMSSIVSRNSSKMANILSSSALKRNCKKEKLKITEKHERSYLKNLKEKIQIHRRERDNTKRFRSISPNLFMTDFSKTRPLNSPRVEIPANIGNELDKPFKGLGDFTRVTKELPLTNDNKNIISYRIVRMFSNHDNNSVEKDNSKSDLLSLKNDYSKDSLEVSDCDNNSKMSLRKPKDTIEISQRDLTTPIRCTPKLYQFRAKSKRRKFTNTKYNNFIQNRCNPGRVGSQMAHKGKVSRCVWSPTRRNIQNGHTKYHPTSWVSSGLRT
ncbi:unnamed protein product [Moneuplotes crassus]|uniref:Uncharacterized protein n=1 Tax=Euplotes crassus TaxID=5936 RepID=A0AAD1U702_EUPCR|nr:unnamed protein product [Moneuplotes crassus]